MTVAEMLYVAAGCALPLYYGPQISRCLRDSSGLASYSLSKGAMQLALRTLMLPFIWQINNTTMTVIVAIDVIGRAMEVTAAVTSLRAQDVPWSAVARRLLPRSSPSRSHDDSNDAL